MIDFTRRNWKYAAMLSIGFLAAIGMSTATPQVYGHITSSTKHVVGDIFNIVTGIDNRLPSDPADQSEVEGAISDSVVDVGPSTGVATDVTVNPADGTAAVTTIIGEESGKTFSGRITGVFFGDSANTFAVRCGVPTAGGGFIVLFDAAPSGNLNEEFACTSLEFVVLDPNDSTDDGAVTLNIVTQYQTAMTT